MPGTREIQYFLSSCVNYHRCHLISWKSLIFKTNFLSLHFIKNFIALGRNLFSRLFSFTYVLIILAFKKNTISKKHFNKMNSHYESQVPFKEREELPLTLNNLVICRNWTWNCWRVVLFVIVLDVVDKYELVINLIIFRCQYETCCQMNGHYPRTHRLNRSLPLIFPIQKVPVE